MRIRPHFGPVQRTLGKYRWPWSGADRKFPKTIWSDEPEEKFGNVLQASLLSLHGVRDIDAGMAVDPFDVHPVDLHSAIFLENLFEL